MELELKQLRDRCLADLNVVEELKTLDNVRIKYLGKKGELTIALKGMGKLSNEERPIIGKLANEIREEIEHNISAQKQLLEQMEIEAQIREESIDVS